MGKRATSMPLTTVGEHTIDRCEAVLQTTGPSAGRYRLQWSVLLPGTTPRVAAYSTIAAGPDLCRRRAKAKAVVEIAKAESLRTGKASDWTTEDNIGRFIAEVAIPRIKTNARLAPGTKKRYAALAEMLRRALKPYTIEQAVQANRLQDALADIWDAHGYQANRQARVVFSGHILDELHMSGVSIPNPLAGKHLHKDRATPETTNAVPLTRSQRDEVIEHLLNLDPADGAERPKRGRYTLEDTIAKRRCGIALTLLQATTGLRITEANHVRHQRDSSIADNTQAYATKVAGRWFIHVGAAVAKSGKPRILPVSHESVVEHLQLGRGTGYVVGSPTDNRNVWDTSNASHVVTPLLVETAEKLAIPELDQPRHRSHLWRATVSQILAGAGVSAELRGAVLGHDRATNLQHYLDPTKHDMTSIVSALQA